MIATAYTPDRGSYKLFFGDYLDLSNDPLNIESISVKEGYRVIAYTDVDYKGPFCVWEGDMSILTSKFKGASIFKGKIYSLKVVKANEDNEVIAIACMTISGVVGISRVQQFLLGDYPDLSVFTLISDHVLPAVEFQGKVIPEHRVIVRGIIESISVKAGYKVITHNSRYSDDTSLLEADAAVPFSDFASVSNPYSLQVVKTIDSNEFVATVFTEVEYGGIAQPLISGQNLSLTEPNRSTVIRSAQVKEGYRVIASTDTSYFFVLEGDVAVVNDQFKDKVRYLRVVKAGPDNEIIATAFTEANYKSDVKQPFFLGFYWDLAHYNMSKKIRSIQIKAGYRVIAYSEIIPYGNSKGLFCIWDGDVAVVSDEFKDKAQALRVVKADPDNAIIARAFTKAGYEGNMREFLLSDY